MVDMIIQVTAGNEVAQADIRWSRFSYSKYGMLSSHRGELSIAHSALYAHSAPHRYAVMK